MAREPPPDKERHPTAGQRRQQFFSKRFNRNDCIKAVSTLKSQLHHKWLFLLFYFIKDPLVLPTSRFMAIECGKTNISNRVVKNKPESSVHQHVSPTENSPSKSRAGRATGFPQAGPGARARREPGGELGAPSSPQPTLSKPLDSF